MEPDNFALIEKGRRAVKACLEQWFPDTTIHEVEAGQLAGIHIFRIRTKTDELPHELRVEEEVLLNYHDDMCSALEERGLPTKLVREDRVEITV